MLFGVRQMLLGVDLCLFGLQVFDVRYSFVLSAALFGCVVFGVMFRRTASVQKFVRQLVGICSTLPRSQS